MFYDTGPWADTIKLLTFQVSTWKCSGLTRKHLTRLERLARDKHSSLLQKSKKYGHNKFNRIGLRAKLKEQFVRKEYFDINFVFF